MQVRKIILCITVGMLALSDSTAAQPGVSVVDGLIFIDDIAPTEKKYALFADSLDKKLKANRNDTTSLFYRALLYLQFNSFVVNPEFSTNYATERLLLARKMTDRADSLQMKLFALKILRAQICKELTTRYAPIETWRFNDRQMAERKKKFDYFKGLTNRYYDELALLDANNAYDYQRLKIKGD